MLPRRSRRLSVVNLRCRRNVNLGKGTAEATSPGSLPSSSISLDSALLLTVKGCGRLWNRKLLTLYMSVIYEHTSSPARRTLTWRGG